MKNAYKKGKIYQLIELVKSSTYYINCENVSIKVFYNY